MSNILWWPIDTLFQVYELNISVSGTMDGNNNMKSPDSLSKWWKPNIYFASKSLDHNTQLNLQGTNNELPPHLSTNDRMLRYRWIRINIFKDK